MNENCQGTCQSQDNFWWVHPAMKPAPTATYCLNPGFQVRFTLQGSGHETVKAVQLQGDRKHRFLLELLSQKNIGNGR